MKKLLFYGTLFLTIGIILVHSLSSIATKYAPDGTLTFLLIDRQHVNELLNGKDKATAIVLGNSHGDDISFPELEMDGYTLARAWGDSFETKYYLNYFLPKLPNLETVFIPISYFTFYWDNASIEKLNLRRSQMYTVLHSWNLAKGDLSNYAIGMANYYFPIQSIIREDHWKGVFYALASRNGKYSVINVLEENCDIPDKEILIEKSASRVKDTISMKNETLLIQNNIQEEVLKNFVDIILLLKEKNIRIVFFTPPYYKAYTAYYKEEDQTAIPLLQSNMNYLIQNYEVEYYDFSNDSEFVNDIIYFKDSDHLNLCGKTLFTRKLRMLMDLQVTVPN